MRPFNRLFVDSGCNHCRVVIPIVERKINPKLPDKNKILIINLTDFKRNGLEFHKVMRDINLTGTPHLFLGEIIGGQIKEDVSIKGSYLSDILESFLQGYFDKTFKEEYQGVYDPNED